MEEGRRAIQGMVEVVRPHRGGDWEERGSCWWVWENGGLGLGTGLFLPRFSVPASRAGLEPILCLLATGRSFQRDNWVKS